MQMKGTQDNSAQYILHQNLFQVVQFPPEGIFSQVLVRSETATHTAFGLPGGQYMKFHNLSGKTVIQVLEGDGVLELCDGEVELNKGTFIFIPAHVTQGLRARTNLTLLHSLTHE